MKKEQGFGTVVLLGLAVVAVACAFALAGYAIGLRQASMLRQLGFAPWPGSSFWADVTLNPLNVPGSSVWTRFQPGAGLDFAFIYAPDLRAAASGLAMLCGGLLIALTMLSWGRNPLRVPLMAIAWGFVGLSVVPLLSAAPASFGLDLSKGMLRDAVLTPGDLQALSAVTGFSETAVPAYAGLTQGYALFATTEGGGQFILGVLNNEGQAVALASALQGFAGSKGQQF
jgi:hypothetical protein